MRDYRRWSFCVLNPLVQAMMQQCVQAMPSWILARRFASLGGLSASSSKFTNVSEPADASTAWVLLSACKSLFQTGVADLDTACEQTVSFAGLLLLSFMDWKVARLPLERCARKERVCSVRDALPDACPCANLYLLFRRCAAWSCLEATPQCSSFAVCPEDCLVRLGFGAGNSQGALAQRFVRLVWLVAQGSQLSRGMTSGSKYLGFKLLLIEIIA